MINKRILVTGGAGSIGSELVRQLAKNNKLYVIDNNETALFDLITELGVAGRVGDITDEHTVRNIFSDFKPQAVFHAAARKHVTPMEQEPYEAINTNVLGLYQVLYHSKVYPVEKFVFISTDKAVDPDSIMGATKRLGEIMVKNSGKGYVAVRFGNVLGSRGSLIPIWEKQMNQGKPITVTDERMTRFFMTIDQACELVIKAADTGTGGEVFVLDMGKQIRILDLAKQIVIDNPNFTLKNPIKITGIRPGEKLSEKLMTSEEEARAIKKGKFFIIK
jgi:FlaA1/EpsC-like NDP-sugar epimerase